MFSLGVSNLGPLPLKNIILMVFFVSSMIFLAGKKNIQIKYFFLLPFIFSGILMSLVLGLSNGFYLSAFSQAALITSSFLTVIISFILFQNSVLNVGKIERVIYFTAKASILTKVALVALVMIGILSTDELNQMMESYFGAYGYDMSSYTGFMGFIPRIGNSGDVVCIIIFIFYAIKTSGKDVFIFWLLTLGLVLISNSRYLMFVFSLACVFIMYIIMKKKLGNTSSILVLILFFTVIFIILSNTELYLYILDRFTGSLSAEADLHRIE